MCPQLDLLRPRATYLNEQVMHKYIKMKIKCYKKEWHPMHQLLFGEPDGWETIEWATELLECTLQCLPTLWNSASWGKQERRSPYLFQGKTTTNQKNRRQPVCVIPSGNPTLTRAWQSRPLWETQRFCSISRRPFFPHCIRLCLYLQHTKGSFGLIVKII